MTPAIKVIIPKTITAKRSAEERRKKMVRIKLHIVDTMKREPTTVENWTLIFDFNARLLRFG